MQIFSNKIERDYNMILKLSQWKQNLLFRRGNVQKKILVVEKKYVWSFLLYPWVKATDHEILWPQPGKCSPWSYGKFCIFQWGSVRCRLPTDCRLLFLGLENNGTIVVMFSFEWWKKKICSVRHSTLTNFPILIWQIHNLYVSYPYSNTLSLQLQWSRNMSERWTMSVLVGMDWA